MPLNFRSLRRASLGVLVLGALWTNVPEARAQEMPAWAAPVTDTPPATPSLTGPGLPEDPPPVPLDGGMFGLALIGAGYAIRRLRDQRR